MDIITFQDPRLLRWAGERAQARFDPAGCRWLAGVLPGELLFVTVYSHFSSRNCQVSIATDGTQRWATRAGLRAIFSLPFNDWGLRRVSFIVDERNEKSMRLMRHRGRSPLGVVEEGRVRAAYPEADGILFGMLKEECKWIR